MQRRLLSGTYECSLDDRFRLAIPARLREPFVGGRDVGWWIDDCLVVVPTSEWPALVERTFGAMSVLDDDGPRAEPLPASRARSTTSSTARAASRSRPSCASTPASRTARSRSSAWASTSRSGNPARLAERFAELRREGVSARAKRLAGRARVGPPAAHEPVLADEVVRAARAAARRDASSTAPSAPAATRAASRRPLGEDGRYVAIDRTPRPRRWFADLAERRGLRDALHPRQLRRRPAARWRDQGLRADAVLMDLGLSSMQVDQPERGFSLLAPGAARHADGPRRCARSAADLVAEAPEAELAAGIRDYGEERYARPIARAIVRRRAEAPIATHRRPGGGRALGRAHAGALRRRAPRQAGLPGAAHRGQRRAGEPGARRCEAAFDLLAPGGRLAVISFHSLEDRRVKRFMRARSAGLHLPARPAGLRLRARGRGRRCWPAKAAAPAPGRARPQPARALGAPARAAPLGRGRVSTRAAARAAAPAPRPRPPRDAAAPTGAARPRPVRAARRRGRLRLGRLAIPLVALVLGGIVWVNVAKLTLTNETGQVIERARSVEAETARLKSRSSSATPASSRGPRSASAWCRRPAPT